MHFKALYSLSFLLFAHTVIADYETSLDNSNYNYWSNSSVTRPNKPAYGYSYVDTVHSTNVEVTRVTGDLGVSIDNTSDTWGNYHKHGYSKRQAFNIDSSLLMLDKGGLYFLNGKTYDVLYKRTAPTANARWHNTKPDIQWYVKEDGEIGEWNVTTDIETVLFTLSGYSDLDISGNGNWSNDGRYVAARATRNSDNKDVFFRIDMENQSKSNDIVVSTVTTDDNYIYDTHAWSISPLGTYLVVVGEFVAGEIDRIKIWNATTGTLVDYEDQYGMPSHHDLAVDENGDEVAVGVAKSDSGSISKWTTIKRKLSNGTLTEILDKSGSHYSTRNLKRPGWVYMSVQSEASMYSGDSNPYQGEVVAIKLDGSRHERIAIMHGGDRDDYKQEHHASPNWDGSKIIFGSDWGLDMSDPNWQVQAYIADLSKYIEPTVHYNFDSSNCANFNDSKGNSDNGSFIGSVSCNTSGVYLNNNDYGKVTRNNIEALMPNNNFSISLWIKVIDTNVTGQRYILNYATSYALTQVGADLKFVIDSSDDPNGNYKSTTASNALTAGNYHHIVATYNSQAMKIYRDGNLVKETSHSGKINNPNKNLVLGGTSMTGTSIRGYLDDIRLFDAALSKDAIDSIYASGRH